MGRENILSQGRPHPARLAVKTQRETTTMATTNHSLTKKLGLETLEKREVCAGNVTAFVDAGGVLQIKGDSAENTVEVREISANVFRVTGLDTRNYDGTYAKTLINGAAFRDFTASKDQVAIDLGAGHDRLYCHDAAMARIDINMGDGVDSVSLTRVTVYGSGASANVFTDGYNDSADWVYLSDCTFAGNLNVATGAGDDYISFYNTQVNGWLSVYGGTGYDRYSWTNSRANQLWAWDSIEGT
jgi:hypothetical protein